MIKVDTYKMNGEKIGNILLAEKIFGIKPDSNLLHQVITTYNANKRAPVAHAKTRAEVRGGGRKPWRQKGTGNARAGSTRSPLWIGGGVTFGPRNTRNWKKYIPKKMRRKALLMALSTKANDKTLIVLDKLSFPKIKTSQADEFLQKMPIKEGTILLILAKTDMNIELSFQNLPYADVVFVGNLNTYEVLVHDYLIASKDALKEMERIYLGKNVEEISKVTTVPKKAKKSSIEKRKTQEKKKTVDKNKKVKK